VTSRKIKNRGFTGREVGIRKEMPCGYEGARRFEVLRFNWVMGNYQLKNTSPYTIICFTGLISSRVTGSHTFDTVCG
ncbi:MAG: hypothetical protein PHS50_14140, partial [Kiritimatiellae bacterium]|nr:hypothetical protein [Kiritimatiellia bacterium]